MEYQKTFLSGIFLVFLFTCCTSKPVVIHGFFQTDIENATRNTFAWRVQRVNLNREISNNVRLDYKLMTFETDNVYESSKRACMAIEDGSKVIFGPSARSAASHIQSITSQLRLPSIQIHWDPRDSGEDKAHSDFKTINLFPEYLTLARAYREVVQHMNWPNFTVIYDDNDGLIRLQEVFKISKAKFSVRKMVENPADFIDFFDQLKINKEFRLVVDLKFSRIRLFLEKALQINALTSEFHYFFTSLDLDMLDLESFRYAGANITSYRLVDPENQLVRTVTSQLKNTFQDSSPDSPFCCGRPRKISTEIALMIDAVNLYAKGLREVIQNRNRNLNFSQKVSCTTMEPWNDGIQLLNHMKTTLYEGLSGKVQFDTNGTRSEFELSYVKLTKQGMKKLGSWNTKLMDIQHEKTPVRTTNNKRKVLKVIAVISKPYVMKKKDSDDEYEGFSVDILKELAKKFNFEWKIMEREDGAYGNCYENGTCTGMVKDLQDEKADMAFTLTITHGRSMFIDFTKPFLNLGLTILFRKPEPEPPQLMSFLDPFHNNVWLTVIASFLGVSFVLLIVARFTPYEWNNPHPCDPTTEEYENQFSVLTSLWYVIAALMQQGCELAPCAVSTRMIATVWWLATLIIISSYTANLAAFLTIEKVAPAIESAEDLANQDEIKYGTTESGSTREFFARSRNPTYAKMADFMERHKTFVKDTESAISKILAGNYAYISESSTIEYRVERNCQLMQVGNWLESKGYGIGLQKNSELTDKFSKYIIKLQEDEVIQKYYTYWWKEKKDKDCSVTKSSSTKALNMKNVGGIFMVLMIGTFVGLLVAIAEFFYVSWKNAKEENRSLCSEMKKEFRFSTKFPHKKDFDVRVNGPEIIPLQNNFIKANGGQDIPT